MMQTTIYLLRHGLVHNPDQVLYGRMPGFRLSDEGVYQAEQAAMYLAEEPIVAIYSSPQQRAQETASYIRAHHSALSVQTDERINEIHSPFDGVPISEMIARDFDLYSDVDPEYEQPQDLVKRSWEFVSEIRSKHRGKAVAAVTHGDIVVYTILYANGEALAHSSKSKMVALGVTDPYLATASVTKLTFMTDDPDELPRTSYHRPY